MSIHKLSFLFLVLLLASCSSDKKQAEQKAESRKKVLVERPVIFGPTQKSTDFFRDKTKELGLDIKATQLYMPDLNRDNRPDLIYLPFFYSWPKGRLYNLEKGKFEEIKEQLFFPRIKASFFGFYDLDNDGIVDCIAVTFNQQSALKKRPIQFFRGVWNKKLKMIQFRLASQFNLKMPTASIGVIDFNLDGQLDLYVGNWWNRTIEKNTLFHKKARHKLVPFRDFVLLNQGGFRFHNASYVLKDEHRYNKAEKIYPEAKATFGVSVCDVNQDGHPDVLTSSSAGQANKLWVNQYDPGHKDRLFTDLGKVTKFAADQIGPQERFGGGNSLFSVCGDYNNDGLMDGVVGEHYYHYQNEKRDRTGLLTGTSDNPLQFSRSELPIMDGPKIKGHGHRGGGFFDFDNNGYLDLLIENSGHPPTSRLIALKQIENGQFQNMADSWSIDVLNPSSVLALDLNRDGKLDLITGQSNVRMAKIPRKVYYFENVMKYAGRGVLVFLQGKRANRYGIGATIKLKTQSFTLIRQNNLQAGPLPGQRPYGVHFGIGDQKIKSIEVIWPISNNGKNDGVAIKRSYNLLKLKANSKIVTLCENGKWFGGLKKCFKKSK